MSKACQPKMKREKSSRLERALSVSLERASSSTLNLLRAVPLLRCASIVEGAPSLERQRSSRLALLAFFCGTGTDSCGRTLEELRTMDFHSMEKVHNFIQWMFPTDEASQFNQDAPVLTPQLQRVFAEDEDLRQELRKNLARFCEFLGLELQIHEGSSVVVTEAPHFYDRWQDCWRARFGRNHNWLRISRVLMCLGRCSLFDEQEALLKCMEKLYAEGVPCGSSIPFWRERAQIRPTWMGDKQCAIVADHVR